MADNKMTLEGAYEELKAENAELRTELDELKAAFEAQKSVSSVQAGGKAEKDSRVKPPKDTFKYKGKTFAIVVGEYINPSGNRVNAATILDDKAEQERLVEIKSGILKEVN